MLSLLLVGDSPCHLDQVLPLCLPNLLHLGLMFWSSRYSVTGMGFCLYYQIFRRAIALLFHCLLSGVNVTNIAAQSSPLQLMLKIIRDWEGTDLSPHYMYLIRACRRRSLGFCHVFCPVGQDPWAHLPSWTLPRKRWKPEVSNAARVLEEVYRLYHFHQVQLSASKVGMLLQTDLHWTRSSWHSLIVRALRSLSEYISILNYFLVISSINSKPESTLYWRNCFCGGPCNQHTRS